MATYDHIVRYLRGERKRKAPVVKPNATQLARISAVVREMDDVETRNAAPDSSGAAFLLSDRRDRDG